MPSMTWPTPTSGLQVTDRLRRTGPAGFGYVLRALASDGATAMRATALFHPRG